MLSYVYLAITEVNNMVKGHEISAHPGGSDGLFCFSRVGKKCCGCEVLCHFGRLKPFTLW